MKWLLYAPFIWYHTKQKDVYNMKKYPTLMRYHYEKAHYYFVKAWGREPGEEHK